MTQYLLLKSDGESDDPSVGLTSDSQGEGGVLGGDAYSAAETTHNNYLELSADSEYVAIDSFLQSSTISGMTVMAWVRSTDSSGEDYISSHDRSEYYRFNLNDGEFDCSFDTSGGGGDHNSGVFVADGQWHHLAAVYDAGEVRMYVDGRRVYTSTGHATEIGSGSTRYGFLGAGSEAASFDGGTNANAGVHDISDHRLYLDAKTDAEVKAAFEGNPPTTELHEYLPLTADDAGRLNDASGNGRHGYLRNGAAILGTETATALSTFQTTNTTSSSSIGNTQVASLSDQLGGGTTSSSSVANVGLASSSVLVGGGISTTLANALRDAFSMGTLGNSLSDTTAGGIISSGSYDSLIGTSDTDAIVNALTKTFDVTNYTGSVESFADVIGDTVLHHYTEESGTISTESLSQAIHGAVSTSPLFSSLSTETTAGGIISSGSYDGLVATLNTSVIVGAITETFDVVDYTGLGESFTGAVGDTTLFTASGTTTINEAIATALVASEQALFTSQSADTSFADAYANALETSTFTTETTATFTDTAITALGQTSGAVFDGLSSDALVEMFAFVSPESASATAQTASLSGETNAIALTEDATLVPLTPTTSLIINVKKGGVGIEGSFADSLSASVGTDTFIKVAKTVGSTESIQGDANTSSIAEALDFAVSLGDIEGSGSTTATLNAIRTAVAYDAIIGTLITDVGASGLITDAEYNDVTALNSLSSSIGGNREQALSDTLESGVTTSVTPEALAETAEALVQDGVVDTLTEAAALISTAIANGQKGSFETSVGSEGIPETFESVDRTGRPTSATDTDAVHELFSGEDVTAGPIAEAYSLGDVKEVIGEAVTADLTTESTSETLAQAATALVDEGIAETEVEGAAIVSEVVSSTEVADLFTFTTAGGDTVAESISGTDGTLTTEAVSTAIAEVFDGEGTISEPFTETLAELQPLLVDAITSDADLDTETTADAITTLMDMEPLDAVLLVLFASITGENIAKVLNEKNDVRVLQ